jgi:drug/metabolite transporter (DMT)-like permease
MNWHSAVLPMVVIAIVVYQLTQKGIPNDSNPFATLAAVYLVSFCISIGALVFKGNLRSATEELRYHSWLPVLLLGVTRVVIELGYLLAYRTGWKISTTVITTGAFTTSMLAIIGILWFKEEVTVLRVSGICLCIIGVIFINNK